MKRIKIVVSLVLTVCLLAGMAPPVWADGAMTVSQEMVDVLKTMEGFAEKPYWDYKQWTVGYGTRCPDAPEGPEGPGGEIFNRYMESGIPEAEAEALLRQELDSFEAAVHSFANRHSLQLKQQEFDALVSFTYNCGSGWMSGGYMQRAVVSGAQGSEFLYAITLYSKAGGAYVLQDRRLCEANMYLNGVYRAYNSGDDALPENYRYIFLDGNGVAVKYGICAFDAVEAPQMFDVEFSAATDSYTLEGWYTGEGKKVAQLDETLERGTVLSAKWTDDQGKEVCLVEGTAVSLEVTVTAQTATIRTGPALFYQTQAEAAQGTKLQLTQIYNGWGKTQNGWVKLTDTDYSRMGTVTGTRVNYRTGPSTEGTTVMGQKFQGDRITIVQIDYSQDPPWGMMDNGYWIRMDFVQLDDISEPGAPDDPQEPIVPVRKGDLTGDSKINSLDGLLLLRYLNGWNVTVKKPEAMDVNADGKVNSLDGLLLLRYLNGWNVTLK